MARSTRARRPHRFNLENLEPRILMAGDVRVALRFDDLTIRGDAHENQVEISEPTPGMIRIAGIDGTRVNRRAFVDVPAGFDDVTVLMQPDGEDEVAIHGPIDFLGDLRVYCTKNGDWHVEIRSQSPFC